MRRRFKASIVVCGFVGLLGLAGLVLAQSRKAEDVKKDPNVVEVRNYQLTMPKLEKYAAAASDLSGYAKAHPEIKKDDDQNSDSDGSIDEMSKTLDAKIPAMASIIHKNGLSTREYVVMSMAIITDGMAVSLKKQGTTKEIPPDVVTPENVAFIEQNYDKIQQILKKVSEDMNSDNGDQGQGSAK